MFLRQAHINHSPFDIAYSAELIFENDNIPIISSFSFLFLARRYSSWFHHISNGRCQPHRPVHRLAFTHYCSPFKTQGMANGSWEYKSHRISSSWIIWIIYRLTVNYPRGFRLNVLLWFNKRSPPFSSNDILEYWRRSLPTYRHCTGDGRHGTDISLPPAIIISWWLGAKSSNERTEAKSGIPDASLYKPQDGSILWIADRCFSRS